MGKMLIKNGRVWDGERFLFADVLTQDQKILKIAPGIEEEANYVFDATGMIVSAGLVDAHVHLRGYEPDKFGMDAQMCSIPFGVTAVADAGGAYADKNLAKTGITKNVALVTVRIADNEALLAPAEEKLRTCGDNVVGLKVFFDVNSAKMWDITPLAQICRFAKERGLLVMVHCSHSPVPMAQILQTLNPGDILTHAFHGDENTAAADDYEAMAEAKKRGVIIDTGFAAHIHTNFAVFRGAVEKGVWPDTISTDITRGSAYRRGGRYGLPLCMSMARTAGMTEEAIFRAVTSAPAKALRREGQWGCLKEGGCADIAVLQYTDEGFDMTDRAGNQLTDTQGYRCIMTVADGDVVWKD